MCFATGRKTKLVRFLHESRETATCASGTGTGTFFSILHISRPGFAPAPLGARCASAGETRGARTRCADVCLHSADLFTRARGYLSSARASVRMRERENVRTRLRMRADVRMSLRGTLPGAAFGEHSILARKRYSTRLMYRCSTKGSVRDASGSMCGSSGAYKNSGCSEPAVAIAGRPVVSGSGPDAPPAALSSCRSGFSARVFSSELALVVAFEKTVFTGPEKFENTVHRRVPTLRPWRRGGRESEECSAPGHNTVSHCMSAHGAHMVTPG